MKSSLITLFLALATAIHAGVTDISKIRAGPENEAERAAGMADAVTPEYKKTHGVTPELEAMILSDGSGGQGTSNYYESFVPVNLMDEGTKKQVETNNHDGLVISISSQPLSRTVATVTSPIVAKRDIILTSSFTVTTTATSTISIRALQGHPPRIPSPNHPIGTSSVSRAPAGSPATAIRVTLTTRASLPIETTTISRIPSRNTPDTSPAHTIPSRHPVVATAGTLSVRPPEGPTHTAKAIIQSHPHSPIRTNAVVTIATKHPVSSEYPLRDPTTTPPAVPPRTTLVTRVRDPTITIG